jgi:hypothetical protein
VGYALAYHADRREGLHMLKTLEKGKRAGLRPVLKDGAIAVRR